MSGEKKDSFISWGLVVAAAVTMLAWDGGASAPAFAQGLDLNVVFNCEPDGPLGSQTPEECAEARELVLTTCTACHTFVPIVKAQKDEGAWNATLNGHASRMQDVSSSDMEMISVFLKAHFNPQNPPPALPPELEALGDIPQ